MAEKSKILIIGGTGYIGKFMVEASAKAGNPTFALVRESTTTSKADLVQKFKNLGVNIINGDINDHEGLVKAIKQVDVVISTVGALLIGDQLKIIDTIKDAGNVKNDVRWSTLFYQNIHTLIVYGSFKSHELLMFGNDLDHMIHCVEPVKTAWAQKTKIRRAVEAQRIPCTYVASNFCAEYFLPSLCQPGAATPPRDKVIIFGDGTPKGGESSTTFLSGGLTLL